MGSLRGHVFQRPRPTWQGATPGITADSRISLVSEHHRKKPSAEMHIVNQAWVVVSLLKRSVLMPHSIGLQMVTDPLQSTALFS